MKLFLAINKNYRNFTAFYYLVKAESKEDAKKKLIDKRVYPYPHAGYMKIIPLKLDEDITKIYEVID